jgi:hypothetical protein
MTHARSPDIIDTNFRQRNQFRADYPFAAIAYTQISKRIRFICKQNPTWPFL